MYIVVVWCRTIEFRTSFLIAESIFFFRITVTSIHHILAYIISYILFLKVITANGVHAHGIIIIVTLMLIMYYRVHFRKKK
jgi:hypothetical protein